MKKTPEEIGRFRGQFRTASGFKVTASFDKRPGGTWKIFSVGGIGVPTQLLPFQISRLPGCEFPSLEEAKLAVKAA
ncbi:hypothetical protein V6R85_01300 [Agrobacterium sp. CCNWLW32]|uniref:hypothetical protein n=1 Tax=Agrobacterium sp. CCNWLW32 TaxID=3122072 RepID=UPI0030100F02